jgi:hypothetical protein
MSKAWLRNVRLFFIHGMFVFRIANGQSGLPFRCVSKYCCAHIVRFIKI